MKNQGPPEEGPPRISRPGAPGPNQRARERRERRRRRPQQAARFCTPRPGPTPTRDRTATRRNQHRPGRRPTSPGKRRKRPAAGPGRASQRAGRRKQARADHRDEARARPTPSRSDGRGTPPDPRRTPARTRNERRRKRKKKRTWQPPRLASPGNRPAGGAPRRRPGEKAPLVLVSIALWALLASKQLKINEKRQGQAPPGAPPGGAGQALRQHHQEERQPQAPHHRPAPLCVARKRRAGRPGGHQSPPGPAAGRAHADASPAPPEGAGGAIKILGCEAPNLLAAHTQPLLFPCRRFALPLRYPMDWVGVESEKKKNTKPNPNKRFISLETERRPRPWGTLWAGRSDGMGMGCATSPSWQARDGAQSCRTLPPNRRDDAGPAEKGQGGGLFGRDPGPEGWPGTPATPR